MSETHEKEKARLRLIQAKARHEEAMAREAIAKAEDAEIELARERDKRQRELAADDQNHVYVFDSDVSPRSAKNCVRQLTEWVRCAPEGEKCNITLHINSPGGEIFSGFALIDFIVGLREDGHRVNTIAYGMAASMGGVILQAGDTRAMGANAFLLIHEGSLGAIGDFGDVEDRVDLMRLMHERILNLFESRAKPINPKTTKTFIKNRWKRIDWWIPAEEAQKLGFVDEIR